ncbi:MAG: hypothetical protein QOI54_2752 [Actinomycetota bacterium]|nr:hypothetical protein [Actinomycetota bacterium]
MALLALALLLPLALSGSDASEVLEPGRVHVGPGRHRPNVVIILTDDQRADALLQMPTVRRLLVDQGTRFTEAKLPTSICCPSRAAILTGLYSHDSGVWSNGGPHGGWRTFHREGNERHTIATTLQRRGYRTGLIGKYLNGLGHWAPPGYRPPGWDRFEGFRLPRTSGAYYDYQLGNSPAYGEAARDYSTDVLATRAVDFIWSTPARRPLFLYFAPFAPHFPYDPAPRDVGALKGVLPAYRPPSATASVADKPAWVRRLPPVSQQRIDYVRERQGESLMAVDDAVGAVVAALDHSERLRDTLIIFMSDNGLQIGEHHIVGKNVPYDAASSIPLVLRWDGHVAAGRTDSRLALNLDIPATVADATGSHMRTDGLSLLGPHRRQGFVMESPYGPRYARPAYCGWRSRDWLFVHYTTGEEELYSYRDDPYELHNRAADPAYGTQLRQLRAQAKNACSPVPPGFRW